MVSDPRTTLTGVHQSAVLSPFLFIGMTRDFPLAINRPLFNGIIIRMYADDITARITDRYWGPTYAGKQSSPRKTLHGFPTLMLSLAPHPVHYQIIHDILQPTKKLRRPTATSNSRRKHTINLARNIPRGISLTRSSPGALI